MHNDRTYAIINITDLASIDFSEICYQMGDGGAT